MTTRRRVASRRTRVPEPQRRAQLLDVTLALLGEDGFGALSMEAIARRAGVNRVVVYRSFANLRVLLLALLRREHQRIERQIDALIPTDPGERHPRDILLEALAGFLAAIEADPLTWRLTLAPPESAPVVLRRVVDRRRAAIERRLRPLIVWGIGRLAVPPDALDEEVVSRMILSVGEEHGRLLLEGGELTRERLLRAAERTLAAVPWAAPP